MSPLWKWPRRKRDAEQSSSAPRTFTGASSDKLRFVISGTNGERTLTVFCPDGFTYSFPRDHPNYKLADELVESGEKDSAAYKKIYDVEAHVRNLFGVVTDRVRVAEGVVYFDEKPIENQVTDQILGFMEEGRKDFTPLAKFLEQLEANPNKAAREYLFSWLEKHTLAIDDDGWVIGFKGVSNNYTPNHRGLGIVNGVDLGPNALIEYKPGNLVSIPRDKVNENPSQHCGTGLHVGTRRFADGFSTRTVEVRFSPADVISVDNSNREKIRVCRLRVVGDAPPAEHYNKALKVGV